MRFSFESAMTYAYPALVLLASLSGVAATTFAAPAQRIVAAESSAPPPGKPDICIGDCAAW